MTVIVRRFMERQHRFEQMHMRVLPPQPLEGTAVTRYNLRETARRMRSLSLQISQRLKRRRQHILTTGGAIENSTSENHKGLIVKVPRIIQRCAFVRHPMTPTAGRVAVFGLGKLKG